ncbi:glutathionyl-hydroquinone reductase YqjG-like [Glandiceps talaboti]
MSSSTNVEENAKGAALAAPRTAFHDQITADGSSGFKAESNRYHLYASLACPFAHRALLVRKLKGLDDVITCTIVDWLLNYETGWNFTDEKPRCTKDPVCDAKYLKEFYLKSDPSYTGRVTVPVLFDKTMNTIVNNESSEIIRMLNSEFNEFCKTEEQKKLDLYPENLRKKIDGLNDWIYPYINGGVYRCGFAETQDAYDNAIILLFDHLDKVEEILSKNRYLTGDQFTEADVRLFATLYRFDTIYVGHFMCNKKRVLDYPNMWDYVRDVYQTGDIAETCDQEHIQKHYQLSHKKINPYGIVSIGPDLDFSAPHNRDKFTK